MDKRERRFHERRMARRAAIAAHATAAERQLEWSEQQRIPLRDVEIGRVLYQSLGLVPVDWDEDDVYVRFGI